MNIPNTISILRLLTAPVLVWLVIKGWMTTAFWLFVAAGISDAVDGFIAKRFDLETTLGKFLDPLADKALLVSVFIVLGYVGLLDLWLVILVVFRDALILIGAILYEVLFKSLTMEPLMISKVNTTAQIVLAVAVLGSGAYGIGPGMGMDTIIDMLIAVVALTTVLSGAIYVMTWQRRAVEMEEGS